MTNIRRKAAFLAVSIAFGLLIITGTYGASPPLQNISVNVVPVGLSTYNIEYEITDPDRGVRTGESGEIALDSWWTRDGVLYWIAYYRNPDLSLYKKIGFTIYDPKIGQWKTGESPNSDISSGPYSDGATVAWSGLNFNGVSTTNFVVYDPSISAWRYGTAEPFTVIQIDENGVIMWRYAVRQFDNTYKRYVGGIVYDGSQQSFRIGRSPQTDVNNSSINSGTITYTYGSGSTATLGYNFLSGFWGGSPTKARAYFVPHKTSGNAPLRVLFWDMSFGTTSWNWSFGDGSSSSTPNPSHIYNSAIGSPYTATLSVNGPNGNNSHSETITTTTEHNITGNVTNISGFDLSNATITLTGASSETTQTDNDGNFSFANLIGGGTYTVTISKNGYTFTPPSKTFNGLSGSQTANFVGEINDTPADYDGDGKTDISIFRGSPAGSSQSHWWILNSATNSTSTYGFGVSTDKVTPRDFDGDGKTDIAVYRPNDGVWYFLKSSDNSIGIIQFGTAEDIPVADDYDGDDLADLALFRPSNGTWYILRSSDQGVTYQTYGIGTDKPVQGDYDGDGKADIAIYRPSENKWYISGLTDHVSLTAGQPVQGDYDGDGITDFATYQEGSNGGASVWEIYNSSTPSANPVYESWGVQGDILTPGDYDGDGKFDYAIYRPNGGVWYVIQSSNQISTATTFGISTDYPTSRSYIPQ